MSSLMSGELQATCSALGYSDGDKYFTEPDCTYALKDLIRYLKHDDENHTVRRELGTMKIMVTDLLPLFKNYWEDKTLLDIVLRLLVNLTNPALVLYEDIPIDRILRNHYLEIVHHLQCYKQAFQEEKIFNILTNKLGHLFELDWEHRQEEDRLIIERILILVRNVLHIPPNPQEEKRTDNDASVHDNVLWALHKSGMENILLYVANSKDESNFCVHVIEIISLMFREQNASQLAKSGEARTERDKQKDIDELANLRNRESSEKRGKLMKFNNQRHSRFGGTFTVKNLKSISDNELICHSPLVEAASLSFGQNKSITKRPRNRALAQETDIFRTSTLHIRLFLKEFCTTFLNTAYNSIMNVVKDNLVRQKVEEHDETYYMWTMRFFMEFNRVHNFQVDLVSETVSLQTFHFIQTEIDKNLEMIRVEDKKKTALWAKRLHYSVKAYAELINTLVAMGTVKSSQVRNSLRVLKGNIFYLTEYRELPLLLLHNYNELVMPKSYLTDVIELTHAFLKLLQEFSKGSSHLIVKDKTKKKKLEKRRPRIKPIKEIATPSLDIDYFFIFTYDSAPEVITPDLESKWENIANDVSAAVQGHLPLADDVQPFDAASDRSMENQWSVFADTMRKIQFSLRESNISVAVALFRAAREIWPEDCAFGTSDIQPEEEFLALREIFFAPLPEDGIKY
uniref:Timeless N-terminal domain-containing protein n=1 Tax=Strigamia maritima TaxID=126957 RepID=T1IWD6_STRMM